MRTLHFVTGLSVLAVAGMLAGGKTIEVRPGDDLRAAYLQLKPGDTMYMRGGTYEVKGFDVSGIAGTPDNWITIRNYPGETPVISAVSTGLGVSKTAQYIVFDGLRLQGNRGGDGIKSMGGSHIIFRNIHQSDAWLGFRGMYGIHDIVVENCTFERNGSHGIYWGTNAECPENYNLSVIGSVMRDNGKHGFQHNGIAHNLVVEGNEISGNTLGGVSLINGVSDSRIVGNTIHDNVRQGVIFYLYDDSRPENHILPFPLSNNVVRDNFIEVSGVYDAVRFWDSTKGQDVPMDNNRIANNAFILGKGPMILANVERLTPLAEGNVLLSGAEMLAMVGRNWHAEASGWSDGDFNLDGTVDLADLAIVGNYWEKANFGAEFHAAAAELGLPAVPEPATLSLLGLGALALRRRRR